MGILSARRTKINNVLNILIRVFFYVFIITIFKNLIYYSIFPETFYYNYKFILEKDKFLCNVAFFILSSTETFIIILLDLLRFFDNGRHNYHVNVYLFADQANYATLDSIDYKIYTLPKADLREHPPVIFSDIIRDFVYVGVHVHGLLLIINFGFRGGILIVTVRSFTSYILFCIFQIFYTLRILFQLIFVLKVMIMFLGFRTYNNLTCYYFFLVSVTETLCDITNFILVQFFHKFLYPIISLNKDLFEIFDAMLSFIIDKDFFDFSFIQSLDPHFFDWNIFFYLCLYILTYFIYNFLVLAFVMIPFFILFLIFCCFKLGFNLIWLFASFLSIFHNNPLNPEHIIIKTTIDYYLDIMSFLKKIYLKIKNKFFF